MWGRWGIVGKTGHWWGDMGLWEIGIIVRKTGVIGGETQSVFGEILGTVGEGASIKEPWQIVGRGIGIVRNEET